MTQGKGRLDSASKETIGDALKLHYADLLAAPLPDRFRQLLDALESGTQKPAALGAAGEGEQQNGGPSGLPDTAATTSAPT